MQITKIVLIDQSSRADYSLAQRRYRCDYPFRVDLSALFGFGPTTASSRLSGTVVVLRLRAAGDCDSETLTRNRAQTWTYSRSEKGKNKMYL